MLGGIVLGGTLLNSLLAIPIRTPRIIGDELIYWQLGRGFAWTGRFVVRGGNAPHYGIVYPTLLAAAQRLGGDQAAAYAVAQVLNSLAFALTAVPIYAIGSRVLERRHALVVAAIAVVVPSCVLTSAIMTENVFYPVFALTALAMLRALERPTAVRQLGVFAACAVAFLTRPQAVVLLPAYLAAVFLLALARGRGLRRAAFADAARRHAPLLAITALTGIAAAVVSGRGALGPYRVLVASYDVRALARWALGNLAEIELYLGLVPVAALGVLFVVAVTAQPLRPELQRLVVLTASLGAALLATVAALSASPYGLLRTHERNLFYVVPLVLVVFFAWLEGGFPRPRRTAVSLAAVLALLPLTIPVPAVATASGEDGLALVVWQDTGTPAHTAIAGMVLAAAAAAAVFLLARAPAPLVGVCLLGLAVALVAGEIHAARAVTDDRAKAPWRDRGWIDRAVGPDAAVVALWATTNSSAVPFSHRYGLWSDEFFNRSVRDVASADGEDGAGLPVEVLRIHPDGCLESTFRFAPRYAVVESLETLDAPVVATSPTRRTVLYRLDERARKRCFARVAGR